MTYRHNFDHLGDRIVQQHTSETYTEKLVHWLVIALSYSIGIYLIVRSI